MVDFIAIDHDISGGQEGFGKIAEMADPLVSLDMDLYRSLDVVEFVYGSGNSVRSHLDVGHITAHEIETIALLNASVLF